MRNRKRNRKKVQLMSNNWQFNEKSKLNISRYNSTNEFSNKRCQTQHEKTILKNLSFTSNFSNSKSNNYNWLKSKYWIWFILNSKSFLKSKKNIKNWWKNQRFKISKNQSFKN